MKINFEFTKPTKKTIAVLSIVGTMCLTMCGLSIYQQHKYTEATDALISQIVTHQRKNQETKHSIETINETGTMLEIANKHGFVDKDTIVFTNAQGDICVIYTPGP